VVAVPPPSPLNEVITEWCTADGMSTPVFSTCNNITVISRLVASGVAMSILPTSLVQHELATGELIRYRAHPEFASRTVCAAYPRASRGSGVDALLNITRRVVEQTGLFTPPR
jgi:DNA-binding transcriptional LysR family regulator